MKLSNLPNFISILRMVLVLPVVILMLKGNFEWALALFILAGLSDAVDGYLAKRFNCVSRLGEILDPLADKLLMVSCYLALWWLNYLPNLLVAVVIGRDFIIVLGAITYHFKIGFISISPSFISKANTTAQILLICVVLFSIVVYELPTVGLNVVFIIVFFTTVVSGLNYIFIWTRRTIKHNR